jgi:hypothetical protein
MGNVVVGKIGSDGIDFRQTFDDVFYSVSGTAEPKVAFGHIFSCLCN